MKNRFDKTNENGEEKSEKENLKTQYMEFIKVNAELLNIPETVD